DYLLLTLRGVVVIDLRDVKGNIFGGDQMVEWTVMDGARRFTFTNPQSALYDRIAAVKAVAGDVPVEGRIVFTRRGRFPKGLPKWTLMIDALRAEFPAADFESPAETIARFRESWQRLREAVKPSHMTAHPTKLRVP
ncbi:MAG: NERD domain-containing protein, partial [Gammaproteobacteria bacterium]|nr:NERD domain-containing protein [Gammaproteobacteria bacterium]